jgi:hypothetical protein
MSATPSAPHPRSTEIDQEATMPGFPTARAVAVALTAVTTAALVSIATAPEASANPSAGTPGSLIYVKSGNIWLSTPDGATTRQLTTDGGTPTADNTGDSGYRAPSESDDGLIVAVRNQEEDKGRASEYTQGYLWELNRYGTVIRKFKPPQFDYLPGGSCNPGVQELPLGIVNTAISPDGKYIAYTAQTYVQTATCDTVQGYSSWVVDADGTNAHQLKDGNGDGASLEVGQWTADSSKLLIDRADFGSIEDFYVNAGSSTGTHWTAPSSDDFIDETYGQPDVRSGILGTEGYSEYAERNAVRIWTTSGFGAQPAPKCDFSSPVNNSATGEILTRPAVSPDGAYVAWEDSSSDGSVSQTGQGIYTVATSTIGNGCNTNSALLVQGGEDPFWTSAGINPPPDTTAPTAALTKPDHPATTSGAIKVAWAGSDAGTGVAYYQLRYRVASYSGGFGTWSTPSGWDHLTGASVTATGLSAGKDYCYSVRAVDAAGNASSWSGSRCTTMPLDDHSLAKSDGWQRDTGHSYYAGTITSTTKQGATLTRANASSIDRIDVLATTCAKCGKVSVYVGSHHIGTIDLHAGSTHHQVLKSLPTFSARSGTVTLKVVTSGRSVAIDGLLLSRS